MAKPAAKPAVARKPAVRKPAAAKPAAAKPAAEEAVVSAAPAPAPAPAPAAAPVAAPARTGSASVPLHEKARQILACMPELQRGETLELRVASQRLREADLLSKSGSSTKLLGQFPELFELLPPGQPNHLRMRR